MYTVFRFVCKTKKHALLFSSEIRLKTSLDCSGPDANCPNRISVSAASDATWSAHAASLVRFLDEYAELLQEARAAQMELEFDMAIEPSDIADTFYVSFQLECDFLQRLGELGVNFGITVYNPDSSHGEDSKGTLKPAR